MFFQPRMSLSGSLDLLRKPSKTAHRNVRSFEARELFGVAVSEDDPSSPAPESTPQVEEIDLDPDLLPVYEETQFYY